MAQEADLGVVQIRDEVVCSIASLAAKEVEGVLGIWMGPWSRRIFLQEKGVKVQIQDQEVRIWLNLIVEYGMNLPSVAGQVQDRVREMVEQMTQLSPAEVHVSIHEIKQRR